MSDLRAELGAKAHPDFAFDLPKGWAMRPATAEVEQDVQKRLTRRLMQAGRPELLAQLRPMVSKAYEKMAGARAVATIGPFEDSEDMVLVPGSMIATIRHSSPELSMDQLAQIAIRKHGAEALFGDPRIMRFGSSRTEGLGGESAIVETITYLTPVPGTKREAVLQLTASFTRPVDSPEDDEPAQMIRLLFDSIVSTLRWV